MKHTENNGEPKGLWKTLKSFGLPNKVSIATVNVIFFRLHQITFFRYSDFKLLLASQMTVTIRKAYISRII